MGLYPSTESHSHPASVIASLWRQRWLSKRIQSQDVLEQVASGNAQTLVDFFSTTARAVDANGEPDPQTDLFLDAAVGQ